MLVGAFCLIEAETGEQSKCYQAARFGGEGFQGRVRHSWLRMHRVCKAVL